jgi:hypothetical protein
MEEPKTVVDLTDNELLRELNYVIKMSDFWYARRKEIEREIERRSADV